MGIESLSCNIILYVKWAFYYIKMGSQIFSSPLSIVKSHVRMMPWKFNEEQWHWQWEVYYTIILCVHLQLQRAQLYNRIIIMFVQIITVAMNIHNTNAKQRCFSQDALFILLLILLLLSFYERPFMFIRITPICNSNAISNIHSDRETQWAML